MEEISTPILIFVFVIVVGSLLIYNIARLRKKSFNREKKTYQFLSSNLSWLREHVSTESDQWPIYARPLMFTEIDHDAQIKFAKAQYAITDANDIIPIIENSKEPETPENFRIDYLFRIFKNLRTISMGNQLNKNIRDLENCVKTLELSVKSIRVDRYRAENKRRGVRKIVRELKYRIEEINTKLKAMDTWNAIESNGLSWVVKLASDCQQNAYEKINTQPDEEKGYLEHALAYVFVEVGNFALDCIELFIESQNISRRYELDLFTNLFTELINFLQSIIEMDIDWNGWKKLHKAKSYVDYFPKLKLEAERSLRAFKNKQQVLEKLIKLINDINLNSDIEYVSKLENDCTYYWFSYEERRADWEQALGSPPRFPSNELNRFQTLLLTETLPSISVDMFIKQSKISKLIKNISQSLTWYKHIKNLISKLDSELQLHKDAQKTVNALLSSQGKATTIISKLKITLNDTSPDFTDEGEQLIKEHQIYAERAQKVRGANFPELEASLIQCVSQAESLVIKHHLEITKLVEEFKTLSENIKKANIEIDNFINYKPRFTPQTLRILTTAYKTGKVIVQQKFSGKYSWLRETTNEMKAWIEKTSLYIEQSQDQIDSFEMRKKQVEEQLGRTKIDIQNQRMRIETSWGWYKNEAQLIVNSAMQLINLQINDWKSLGERKWAEFTIYKVMDLSEEIIRSSEDILNSLNQKIGDLQHKQIDLNNKIKDINNFRIKNLKKLSQEDQSEINELIKLAGQAEHYDTVQKYLQHALSLALRRANHYERASIKNIINIHSQGGPVFTGNVDNRYGKITGSSD